MSDRPLLPGITVFSDAHGDGGLAPMYVLIELRKRLEKAHADGEIDPRCEYEGWVISKRRSYESPDGRGYEYQAMKR